MCFKVRKRASEYGLSSETCGRLKDGTTPSHCKVVIMVLARMGANRTLERLYLMPALLTQGVLLLSFYYDIWVA